LRLRMWITSGKRMTIHLNTKGKLTNEPKDHQ
jgi:hypothetical protein